MNPSERPRTVRLSLLLAFAGLAAAGLGGCTIESSDMSPPSPEQITGRYVAVVCDADVGAQAFADGYLHRVRQDAVDMMCILGLPILPAPSKDASRWQTRFAQVPVSSSVLAPPVGLAISPDGTQAYVVETHQPAPPGAQRVDDLPPGTRVAAVDLTDPMNPGAPQTVEVGPYPTSVDVSPMGDLLAVTTGRPGEQLVLVRVMGGQMGQAMAWPLVGLDDDPALPPPVASAVAWSPDGRYLAITLPARSQVVFFEFAGAPDAGGWGLAPYGLPVNVGADPLYGRFTPDGRHFVVTSTHVSAGGAGGGGAPMAGAPEGSLSVIRLSDERSAVRAGGVIDPTVQHRVVSTSRVGVLPRGLAISPDGRYVATSNLRGSMLPAGNGAPEGAGSISLLTLDPSSGALASCGEFLINAMPQGLAWDKAGKHLLVTKFQSADPQAVDGEMAFYKLVGRGPGGEGGGRPTLVPGREHIGVGVGPHGVIVVR